LKDEGAPKFAWRDRSCVRARHFTNLAVTDRAATGKRAARLQFAQIRPQEASVATVSPCMRKMYSGIISDR